MIPAFLLGAFGALAAEILQRWKQFNDLPEERFKAIFKTWKFWAFTAFLLLLGGVGGLVAVTDPAHIDWKVCLLGGVGAMSLIRGAVTGAAAQAENAGEKLLPDPKKAAGDSVPGSQTEDETPNFIIVPKKEVPVEKHQQQQIEQQGDWERRKAEERAKQEKERIDAIRGGPLLVIGALQKDEKDALVGEDVAIDVRGGAAGRDIIIKEQKSGTGEAAFPRENVTTETTLRDILGG